MNKRISIRLVYKLYEKLKFIAKDKGLSLNSLIIEVAWDFVNKWNESE
nr:MAG TPA: hypothetical protein [Caudoviricetes sp.]DAM81755.1 MAG TPA: hypothetical protein [Caudoviricetes sp.]